MPKHRVDHKKISGNHTTLIAAAVPLVKSIIDLETVRRISPGFIRAGLRNLQKFPARVKITTGNGHIKLVVRAQTVVQEIYVYTSEPGTVMTLIAATARTAGYQVTEEVLTKVQ